MLGEFHHDKDGNVQDVIRGLRTSRFMYEPFNELADTKALAVPFTGTQTRLEQANKDIGIPGSRTARSSTPTSRTSTIKALTGASIARNEFIPARPRPAATTRTGRPARARATTLSASGSRCTSRSRSTSRHDLSKHDFGPATSSSRRT